MKKIIIISSLAFVGLTLLAAVAAATKALAILGSEQDDDYDFGII